MFLLCILEAQWRYHTIEKHDLPETSCLKFWKCVELEVFCIGIKEFRIKKLKGN